MEFLTLGVEITHWQEYVGVLVFWAIAFAGGIFLPYTIARDEGSVLVFILSVIPLLPLFVFIGAVGSLVTTAMLGL